MENTTALQYTSECHSGSTALTICHCGDNTNHMLDDLYLDAPGRILRMCVRMKDICPGRRTAVAITLHELDDNGNEHARGIKTFTMPAHSEPCSRDILIRNIRFVLPDDEDFEGCENRKFVVRTLAHYVDAGSCGCLGDDQRS